MRVEQIIIYNSDRNAQRHAADTQNVDYDSSMS